MSKMLRVLSLLLISTLVFAGGMVENTNQSADWIRMMARNASTDLDAAYFNPAGLTSLPDGLHLYLSNQSISQTRTITSDVATLHSDTFDGTTSAPLFPNLYFAYKTGSLVFSGGFVPIGGGGSATFDKGLPSFEAPVSVIPASLAAAGIPTTAYSLDVSFEGSSTYLGGQFSVAYEISKMISVSVGARYFAASNSYLGHLTDIKIDPNYPTIGYTGSMVSAPTFFTTLSAAATEGAAQATAGAGSATAGASSLQPFIDGGAGDLPFNTLVGAGQITQAQVDAISAGLTALGVSGFDASTWTPSTTQVAYTTAAASLTAYAATLTSQADDATVNAAKTSDVQVDAQQTGSGFAPIVGLYLSPMENLNIGIRYEGMAALELTNKTKVDGSGLFPDGAKSNADMPAMLGVGLSYRVMPSLNLALDYNYYFNKDANWDGRETLVDNGTEIALGAEFALTSAMTLSGGYLISTGGAKEAYNTDMSNSLNSSTVGFGVKYALNPTTAVSVGFSNTFYEKATHAGVDYFGDGVLIGTETYLKTAIVGAIGISRSF